MNLIRDVVTIVMVMFFIPIMKYLLPIIIESLRNINIIIRDVISYINKLICNKVKLVIKRRGK